MPLILGIALFISFIIVLFIIYLWYPLIVKLPAIFRTHLPSIPVVVFESDDWGGLRDIDFFPDTVSNKDCLETTDELAELYDLLKKHKDSRGRSAVFTLNVVLNTIVLDKDSNKLLNEDVPQYVIDAWKDGVSKQVVFPQLHAMREADAISLSSENSLVRKRISPYMVWEKNKYVDLPTERVHKVIKEGQEKFTSIFGFESISTIAPRYLWGETAGEAFVENGIRYIQRGIPTITTDAVAYHNNDQVAGERVDNDLMLLAKKVDFEPYYPWNKGDISAEEYAKSVSKKIIRKLDSYEPVSICTHRWNYVSCSSPGKPVYSLTALKVLLEQIVNRYQSIVFLTSVELGELLEYGVYRDVFTSEKKTLAELSFLQRLYYFIRLGNNSKRNILVTGSALLFLPILWVSLLIE